MMLCTGSAPRPHRVCRHSSPAPGSCSNPRSCQTGSCLDTRKIKVKVSLSSPAPPDLHHDGAAADTEDVAGAVTGVRNVHRGILRGIGTLVTIDTLAPDIRENATDLR